VTQTNTYDPEQWLLSTMRALKEYAEDNFNDAYEIVMEYPGTEEMFKKMPLVKTLVHFEIDVIDERRLGFGDNIGEWNYDDTTDPAHPVAQPQEAAIHVINFDVGAWATDRSGGTTSRARVKQTLGLLFQGKIAQENLDAAVNDGDGRIEIVNYTGGRFLTDRINDVDVYRIVDCSLDVRVFSRTPKGTPIQTIEEELQDPNLDVGGVTIP